MRIAYVWDAEYPWEVRVEKICLALVEGGNEVRILARNRRGDTVLEDLPEGEVHRLAPMPSLFRLDGWTSFPAFFNPRWLRLLWRTARGWRPDVIIVREIPLAPTAIWVGRRWNTPVVLDMAEHYPAMIRLIWETGRTRPFDRLVRNPRAVAAVERWVARRVDGIWVDVEEQAERLIAQYVQLPPITVVRNTPPLSQVGAEPLRRETASGRLEAVYLGILELQRGVSELLEATALLRNSPTPVRAVIIGGGRDEHIFRQQAADIGLGLEDVEFCGFLPRPEALNRMTQGHVGVNPIHRNEKHDVTLPNKVFDYMAAGLPVLTSDSVPSARLVRSIGCGEVFRAGDARDLAARLVCLWDPDIRLRQGRLGQDAIRTTYHWERDAGVVRTGIVEVVRRHRTRPGAQR
jgi:glycosyltransferase involved in cell wall biosynthesis